ncbi:MAG: WYL domain-containing protein [Bacteroidetes bacterium]|jgi:predicted DNA-binding transcriptional regulator YafY|nr:WYL domain-containing protein [Bacteroidota bacterium]
MGSSKKQYMRYRLIDEALNSKSKPYPSLDTILEYVNQELNHVFGRTRIARRTIQVDLKDMRFSDELGYYAPIAFHRTYRGYYYEDEGYSIGKLPLRADERQVIELVAQVLSRYENIPMFYNFKHITQKIFDSLNIHSSLENDPLFVDAIHFDTYPHSVGSKWLSMVTEAIRSYRKLHLDYRPFGSEILKKRVLHPYILKEYKGRWYVVGLTEPALAIRTYALDRVEHMRMDVSNFPLDASFDRKGYFDHSFGIYNLDQEGATEVVLECYGVQGNYVLSRPLHATQQVVTQGNDVVTISLMVYISEDLIMELLSFGNGLKVLAPISLAQEIANRHLQALKRYQ